MWARLETESPAIRGQMPQLLLPEACFSLQGRNDKSFETAEARCCSNWNSIKRSAMKRGAARQACKESKRCSDRGEFYMPRVRRSFRRDTARDCVSPRGLEKVAGMHRPVAEALPNSDGAASPLNSTQHTSSSPQAPRTNAPCSDHPPLFHSPSLDKGDRSQANAEMTQAGDGRGASASPTTESQPGSGTTGNYDGKRTDLPVCALHWMHQPLQARGSHTAASCPLLWPVRKDSA